MTSNSFPSELQCVPVPGEPSTFRLEVQVLGSGHAPARTQCYALEYLRNAEKWDMAVVHYPEGRYRMYIRAPETVKDFAYRKYQRSDFNDIQYMEPDDFLEEFVASFYIGAEVTVSGETPTGGTLSVGSESPWDFASSDEMPNWDVVLFVGDSKFYAHRQFLVPLATLAQYFNVKPAMVKRIEMLARLPCVSKLDKFRVALEIHSSALEDEVISALSKEDIRELLASDVKEHLNDVRWEKIVARSLSI